MGQDFKITNVDKRHSLQENGYKFCEILGDSLAERLVDLLQVPQLRIYKLDKVAIAAARSRSNTSRLVALPQELVDAIVAFIGSDMDIICLALTNSYFFRLLGPTVREAVIRDEAPWAGDHLVVVGAYASGVPKGLLTDNELSAMEAQVQEERREDGEGEAEWAVRNPLFFMNTECVHDKTYRSYYCWQRRIRRTRDRRLSGEEMVLLDRLLRPEPHLHAQQAVLRNLDTQEYVRDLAIAESEFAYSLGEVICTHAHWTDDDYGMKRIGSKGMWAGCRFDIATNQDVDGDWTDVSERAIDYLQRAPLYKKASGKRAVIGKGLQGMDEYL